MNKEIIMKYLKSISRTIISSVVLEKIDKTLNDYHKYKFVGGTNTFSITSEIKPGSHGDYTEITYNHDPKTLDKSLVITTKSYSPTHEVRYGFMQEVALNMFTQSNSYVWDENDNKLYHSWFSDEHKYFGSHEEKMDYSVESLKSYFEQTTPTYEFGIYKSNPKSAYQPFKNIWERYGKTNVIHQYGRNPIKGEYSEIGITFDDESKPDEMLLSESYGQIYSRGREMKLSVTEEIVAKIDEIYQECNAGEAFDSDTFHEKYESEMFTSKRFW